MESHLCLTLYCLSHKSLWFNLLALVLCLVNKVTCLEVNANLFSASCRCIAVKTTLSEESLKTADPSLIRNDIGNISLDDILSGGSDDYSM